MYKTASLIDRSTCSLCVDHTIDGVVKYEFKLLRDLRDPISYQVSGSSRDEI